MQEIVDGIIIIIAISISSLVTIAVIFREEISDWIQSRNQDTRE